MSSTSYNPWRPDKGADAVRIWLLVVAVMVYGMILVGGATRLTDSGLSITEWQPLLGALPPMNDADWQEAFAKYQTMTTQFHAVNPSMDMEGFRAIFWWEWAHRFLGRVIGVVFAVPFFVFLFTGRTTARLRPHLWALFALGGFQGFIGWWMVSSGVNSDLISVAPFRLMVHFCLALLIICYCVWLWLEVGGAPRAPTSFWQRSFSRFILVFIFWQMGLGALVAGNDAGRGYTDWPLMAGKWVPDTLFYMEPWWRNLFENEAAVQFGHRYNAYSILACVLGAAIVWRNTDVGFRLLAGLVLAQSGLGIWTLVNAAPLDLSLAHQGLGVLTMLAAVRLAWRTRVKAARPLEDAMPSPARAT
jgi:heme a synthase